MATMSARPSRKGHQLLSLRKGAFPLLYPKDEFGLGGMQFRCLTDLNVFANNDFGRNSLTQEAKLTNSTSGLISVQTGWDIYFPISFGNFEYRSIILPDFRSFSILRIPSYGVVYISQPGVVSMDKASPTILKVSTYFFLAIPPYCTKTIALRLLFDLDVPV